MGRATRVVEGTRRAVTPVARNPRRVRGGATLLPVAVVETITAASGAKVTTRTTITETSVTCHTMGLDDDGHPYYDTTTAKDVDLIWRDGQVTVSEDKFKIGWRQGNELIGVGCVEYPLPDPPEE